MMVSITMPISCYVGNAQFSTCYVGVLEGDIWRSKKWGSIGNRSFMLHVVHLEREDSPYF